MEETIQAAEPSDTTYLRLKRAEILDRNGFDRILVATTLAIPVEWQPQGGIVWPQQYPGCGPNLPHFNWAATAPDGIAMVALLPDETWSGTNMPMGGMGQQCPNIQITDIRDFILNYIERYRPGAQLLDYREDPDLTRKIEQDIQATQAALPPIYGVESRMWGGYGIARITYTVSGHEVVERIGLGVTFQIMRMANPMGFGTMDTLTITTLPAFAVRLPREAWDQHLADAIGKSVRVEPEWLVRIQQFRGNMNSIAAQGAAERSRIMSDTFDEISDMQMQGWNQRQQSSDRMQRETIEAIRDVETYDAPYSGGTVQLDNSYQHAWQLSDGTFILTNDSSFDPGLTLGIDGTKLKKTR